MTTINSATTLAQLDITNNTQKENILSNLKNTVKLQLAIATLFHDKSKNFDGKTLTIDVNAGTISVDGSVLVTVEDNVTNNTNFPICNTYRTVAENSALTRTNFSSDGNFYDGFFSMFDGKATSVPTKKTKKSKRGGKKL